MTQKREKRFNQKYMIMEKKDPGAEKYQGEGGLI